MLVNDPASRADEFASLANAQAGRSTLINKSIIAHRMILLALWPAGEQCAKT
jgi:hypothetical protein